MGVRAFYPRALVIPIICAPLYFFFSIQYLIGHYAKKILSLNSTFFGGSTVHVRFSRAGHGKVLEG